MNIGRSGYVARILSYIKQDSVGIDAQASRPISEPAHNGTRNELNPDRAP
jgi:hypothetical protein